MKEDINEMPTSVYQPTTISYESRPGALISQASQTSSISAMKILKKPFSQIFVLLISLLAIAVGVALLLSGVASYDKSEYKDKLKLEAAEDINLSVIAGGFLLTMIGCALIGIYIKIKFEDWRHSCANSDTQILALNPSTDPLVSHTQYAPVSELSARLDEEERLNLMPENKDCFSSAEESDRILDPDPRIVLRPLGRVEEV